MFTCNTKLQRKLVLLFAVVGLSICEGGDYLEPIAPYSFFEYRQRVFNTLIGIPPRFSQLQATSRILWVMKYPAFSPESAVFLDCISKYQLPKDHDLSEINESHCVGKTWILKYAEAGDRIADSKFPVEIKKQELVISEEFSMTIKRALEGALSLTSPSFLVKE